MISFHAMINCFVQNHLPFLLFFIWLVCETFAKAQLPRDIGEKLEIPRVSRHNLVYEVPPQHPLFTGNGSLGMSVDASGTQLLKQHYAPHTVSTIAQNIWYDPRMPEHLKGTEFSVHTYPHGENHTLAYPYASTPVQQELYDWLRRHPNKCNLANFALTLEVGEKALRSPVELTVFDQQLDLYDGLVRTHYQWEGVHTRLESFVHATKDLIVFHVADSAISPVSRTLRITISDPEGFDPRYETGPPAPKPGEERWRVRPLEHTGQSSNQRVFWALRPLPNGFSYGLIGGVTKEVESVHFSEKEISVELAPRPQDEFTVFLFIVSEKENQNPTAFGKEFIENALQQGYPALLREHQQWWHDYWGRSAIELESGDERGKKLEEWYYRSLYYLASNDRGPLPPAEGGLVANSWFGKFHLEMHFWHAAGFLAANRPECVRPSLQWYLEVLPQAKKNAEAMGLKGAKYPKMTSFRGQDSPGLTNLRIYWHVGEISTLIWWYYLYTQDREFLRTMYPVLAESADFVASFLVENPTTAQYELWPPIATCDETTDFDKVRNPAFELAEFKAALNLAIAASELLRQDENKRAHWIHVRDHLAPIANNGEVYLIYEGFEESWTPRHTRSHPSVLGPFFPAFVVPDDEMIRATYDKVLALWNWDEVWGWDFGFAAAVGAWLNRPEDAVQCLLKAEKKISPVATFSGGGVNSYLPGNGALVLAINEMLLRSLDGTLHLFSGIPSSWRAKFENLRAAGGFLISAEKQGGVIGPISIKSLAGQSCRLEVPKGWRLEDVEIESEGQLIRKRKISPKVLEFDARAGRTYSITFTRIQPKSEKNSILQRRDSPTEKEIPQKNEPPK